MNPHFRGDSIQIVKLEKLNKCSDDNILDGGFVCWAGQQGEDVDGIFPFVFDCPDINVHKNIRLPQSVEVQVSAFAHEVNFYDNDKEFEDSQSTDIKFASESFIPSGMFSPKDNMTKELKAMAIMNGHIIEVKTLKNSHTNMEYVNAIIEVQGCRFDVVIDNDLVTKEPKVGGVLGGVFWLTGKIVGKYDIIKSKGLISKLFGKQ